ncbi:carboxypeptidase-like regulatory domain-containing protein [Flavobacterium macacae]|uniref:carboxypeptidase-like regulatory domain-containing protein n=1 Tax=Flavobacterium macacae TaxID=2488993 RepID=UPI00131569FA|nr:carboxypeptidase-like regulatory domain-containing protein [Flavobacterium macacae]
MFFIVLFCNNLHSQILSGTVLDADSNSTIDLASIYFKESKYTIFSDSNGKFSVEIDTKNQKEALVISSVGYQDLKINLKKYTENKEYQATFKLFSKVQTLDEVVISNKKINYSSAKTITSKRNGIAGLSFQFGTENVTLVQNPYVKNGKIKKVILSLKKATEDPKQPKWKIDYTTAYNIKFYKYDARNQKPSEELYNKNIIVEPGNKTQDFVIDVDSLHIPFPKEGVCVGVEYVNTRYKNPKTNFALIAPTMNFYQEEKLKPIISWSRYRGEDWEFRHSFSNFKNRRYQNVMVVDLVVNTEK